MFEPPMMDNQGSADDNLHAPLMANNDVRFTFNRGKQDDITRECYMLLIVKKALRHVDQLLFGGLSKHYIRQLEGEIIGRCDTVLDVGCGFWSHSPMKTVSSEVMYSVGLDCHLPSIESNTSKGLHDHYVYLNALELDKMFAENSFDCVVALDIIEHLRREDGLSLLAKMEKVARKKVIVVTPNGFVEQKAYDGNPYQEHVSGWSVQEMRELGYRVTGIHGWKRLKGERALVCWRPRWLWVRISLMTQMIVQTRPQHSFTLFCVKDLGD